MSYLTDEQLKAIGFKSLRVKLRSGIIQGLTIFVLFLAK
jgi:hypothetical protein